MMLSLGDDGPHMLIRQRVEDRFPFPAALYQSVLLQDLQLMGNRRLGHIQHLGQVTDTNLRLKQHKQDPDPGGIPKCFEQFRQIIKFRLRRHQPADKFQPLPVKFIGFTAQFFFFHYLLVVMSLDPREKTSDKLWEYYYDETYKGIRKISTDLSSIEWFSKKKIKTTANLHQAVLQMMYDIVKFTDRKNKKSMLSVIDTPHLKEIKDNAILLASANEYAAKEIVRNFERVQDELKELKQSQK